LSAAAASKSEHPRPAIETPYAEAGSEIERLIAGIWQELLGIDRVGIDDNFFELGGDSVVAIQIMVRINKAGFNLTTRQLFQCQTIRELAQIAVAVPLPQHEDEAISKYSLAGLNDQELRKLDRLINKTNAVGA
jgi:acyl carrier protein